MAGLNDSGEFSDVLEDVYLSGAVTVSTTQVEAKVGGSRSNLREMVSLTNQGPGSIFYGPSGVTTSTGDELRKDQNVVLPIGDMGVFMIKDSGSATVIVQEIG